jgi:hypothetical protein
MVHVFVSSLSTLLTLSFITTSLLFTFLLSFYIATLLPVGYVPSPLLSLVLAPFILFSATLYVLCPAHFIPALLLISPQLSLFSTLLASSLIVASLV